MKKLTLPLTGILAIAFAGVAFAHPGGGGRGKHGPKMSTQCKAEWKAKKLAKLDLDGDGTISRAERRQARQARRAEMLAEFDADGDGSLSQSERKTMRYQRSLERFEKLDVDENAELSKAEVGDCGRLSRHFARVDADGSGSITWAELEQAKQAKKKYRGKRGKRGWRGQRGKRGKHGWKKHRGASDGN